MLNDTQIKFLTLAEQYEATVEQLKKIKEQIQPVMSELGVGTFLQDPNDGTVYQVVNPTGKFVFFDPIDYIRTRKITEDKGDLSIKKAEEAGYSMAHLKKA